MRVAPLSVLLFACGNDAQPNDAIACEVKVAPRILVSDPSGGGAPSDIALDDGAVYWVNFHAGTIGRVAKDGGPPLTVVDGEIGPRHLAVDDTSVYWTTSDGSVRSADKTTGSARSLFTGTDCPASQQCGNGMVIDRDAVYWIDIAHHQLMRLEKASGAPTTLASNGVTSVPGLYALDADATDLYWGGVDDSALMTDGIYGALWTVPKTGGTARIAARFDASDLVSGIGVDDANIYVAMFSGRVWRVPKDGSGSELLITVAANPQGVAAAGAFAYVAAPDGIAKVSVAGDPPAFAACDTAGRIALDERAAYWNGLGATISTVPR